MTNPKGAMPAYQIGDEVQWTSQAAGIVLTKRGTVVAVVAPGDRPKLKGCGWQRDHESYVVRVKCRGLYWPRTSSLKKADALLAALATEPQQETTP